MPGRRIEQGSQLQGACHPVREARRAQDGRQDATGEPEEGLALAGRSVECLLEEMTSKPAFDCGRDLATQDRRGQGHGGGVINQHN